MNLAATIAKMRACGMSADAIVQALECIVIDEPSPAVDEQAERRRAADRERKAKERLRKSAEVCGTSAEEPSPLVPPFPPAPPNPPIIPPTTKHSARATPKTNLPDDWEPDAKTWALADDLGFTSQEAWDQLERMRDWAKNADGGKGRKSDWNAAFRNWLKRASDEKRNRPSASRQRNSIHATLDAIDACADEAIRRSGGHGPEGREEDPDILPGLWKGAA